MKTIFSILIAFWLVGCVAPAPVQPVPPAPPRPPVVVVPTGVYLITPFDQNGVAGTPYEVDSYDEQNFPRRVTFIHEGQTVTLEGSYQIDQRLR